MTGSNRHIVFKSILDISIPQGKDDPAVLQEIRNRFYAELLQVMEKVFDEIGDDNNVVRLDHLELDLGELKSLKEEVLKNRFESLLRQNLREEISRRRPGQTIPEETDGAAQEILWFLEFGTFPWWSDTSNIRELEKEFLSLLKDDISFIKRFEVLISEDKPFWRYVYSFSDDFIRKATSIIASTEWNNAQQHYQFLSHILQKGDKEFQSDKMFRVYSEQLLFVKYKLKRWDLALLTENFFQAYFKTFYKGDDFQTYLEALTGQISRYKTTGEDDEMKQLVSSVIMRISEKQGSPQNFSEDPADWRVIDPDAETNILNLEDRLKDDLSKRKRKFFGDEHYIRNAGLILVYPYLKEFFKNTRIINDDQIKGVTEGGRAVLLLHYAAFKDAAICENELLLNKLLCGLPEDYPINPQLELSEKDKKAVEEMLTSMVKNWKVLKTTSPDGLREAFLQREGVLEYGDNHWKLRVERRAIDLLLEELPYPISIIILPWIKHRISVEW